GAGTAGVVGLRARVADALGVAGAEDSGSATAARTGLVELAGISARSTVGSVVHQIDAGARRARAVRGREGAGAHAALAGFSRTADVAAESAIVGVAGEVDAGA